MSDQSNVTSPEFLEFIKSPVKEMTDVSTTKERISIFIPLLISEILLAVCCGGIIAGLSNVLKVMEGHKVQSFFEDGPVVVVFVLGVGFGPVIEEMFFRLHLRLNEKYLQFNVIIMITGFVFILVSVIEVLVIQISLVALEIILLSIYFSRREQLNKYILSIWERKYFYVFYISIAAFGLLHITNYTPKLITYLFMPILVLPQIVLGTFCGYIRVRLGIWWSCLFHASHNFIFIIPFLITSLFTGLNNKSVNPNKHENIQPADTEINQIEIVDSMGSGKLTKNFEEQYEFRFNMQRAAE